MSDSHSINHILPGEPEPQVYPPHTDPEFPHIPYTIYRPARGSPYYINPGANVPPS